MIAAIGAAITILLLMIQDSKLLSIKFSLDGINSSNVSYFPVKRRNAYLISSQIIKCK